MEGEIPAEPNACEGIDITSEAYCRAVIAAINSDEGIMDYIDLLQQRDLRDLRDEVTRLQQQNDEAGLTPRSMKELLQENLELKLRLGLLVRLLIQKGIFTAEEFAQLLTEARQSSER